MTTIVRLLQFVRRYRASPVLKTTKLNLKNSSAETLFYSQNVFSSPFKNYASTTIETEKQRKLGCKSNIDRKITLMKKEIHVFGTLPKSYFDDILQDFIKSETLSNSQALFLLHCCNELMIDEAPDLRTKLADNTWKMLKKLGVELDVSHYNALLSIYNQNQHEYSPLDFLNEMINADIKPNKVTFQRLIFQFCDQGKIEEANQILEHMKNEKIIINEDIISSFIHGHLVNNDKDAAVEAFNTMVSYNITPTKQTYSVLMYFYAKNGDICSLRQVFEECQAKDVWITDEILLNVIYFLGINGFTQYVDEILLLTSRGSDYIRLANKTMYKLMENQKEDIALKIFQTIPQGIKPLKNSFVENPRKTIGNFYIKTLIDKNASVEKSIEFCRFMETEGINRHAFISAIKKNIARDMHKSSTAIMSAWKELGGLVREHYFYPIIKAYGESDQLEDLQEVLEKMLIEFQIKPSIYTLRNIVIPSIKRDYEEILSLLLNSQVDIVMASNAIFLYLLSQNKIREAVSLLKSNSLLYKMRMVKHSLLQAFKNTEDAHSFVWILHYLYKTEVESSNAQSTATVDNDYVCQQFVDSCILEAVDLIPSSNKYLILMVLKNLIDKGLNLSPQAAEEIQKKLNNDLTPTMLNYLNLLKSGNLILKPIHRQFWFKKSSDIEKMENTAKILSVTNPKISTFLKKNLLFFYCRNKSEKKVEEIVKEFENNNIILPNSACAAILNMYLSLRKLDKTELILDKFKNRPDFQLKKSMVLKLMRILVRNNQLAKAIQYLETLPISTNSNSEDADIYHLLQAVAKHGNEDLLLKIFDLLSDYGYIKTHSHTIHAPIIQFYVEQNDLKSALQKFEWVYKKFNRISDATLIMNRCVREKDQESLDRVLNIAISSCGVSSAYFDLAIAYLNNNDAEKAKYVIQEHCSNIPEEQVLASAQKYYKFGQTNNLEKLFGILNDLMYDVEKLCVILLKSYGTQNEWEKGFDLWKQMQNSDIQPSDSFVDYLNLIIQKKHSENNDILRKFFSFVQKDIKLAESLLDDIPMVHKRDCYYELCRIYTRGKQYSKVFELWQDLNKRFNLNFDPSAAEHIMKCMVNDHEVNLIDEIETFLSPQFKKESNYNYYLNQVYLEAGVWNLYLKKLKSKLSNGTLFTTNLNMNIRIVIRSLKRHPELLEEYETLACECHKKGIVVPMHLLWIYYFSKKTPRADELWEKYLRDSNTHTYLKFVHFYMDHDLDLQVKLAELLRKCPADKNLKFDTYKKLLKTCLCSDHPEKYKIGLECLELGLTEFPMERFGINLLVDLQKGLENSGIRWPWTSRMSENSTSPFQGNI